MNKPYISNADVNSLYSSVNTLEWRRSKVLGLSSRGRSQPEIDRILHISQSTVNRDLQYLRFSSVSTLMKSFLWSTKNVDRLR